MKKELGHEAIYDARQLGTPRMLVLGLQHMFAMFGATVLVPILVQGYGLPLSIQTTLLFAGLGTLLFHVCTKMKVPAFLGSSFAYLGGFETVAKLNAGNPMTDGLRPVMTVDVWEHAYYIDYRNRRPDFLAAFWELIDWQKVADRCIPKRYKCTACDYVYDPAKGDPETGIEPGTPFEEIPDDWTCPICGLYKTDFEAVEE